MTLEREDIGGAPTDPLMVAMHQHRRAVSARRATTTTIFADLAERLGARRGLHRRPQRARNGCAQLYEPTAPALAAQGPRRRRTSTSSGQRGELMLPQQPDDGGILRAFRDDPDGHPLPTPSGKIEIFSATIAGFGYADCPGHPAWLPPADAPSAEHAAASGRQPAGDAAAQPARFRRPLATAQKHRGREVVRMHPRDAAARGIADGDIVRLFNERGACLAAVDADRRRPRPAWCSCRPAPGTTRKIPTEDKPLCVHGNPNVLTRDVGTSRLAQGCTGQLTTVQVERFTGNLPPIQAFDPPVAAAGQ